ncbi:MAG: hypothetical protein KBA64_11430 [Armatimonadetes bacterium]|nr:hypothetical protein [Armatimonadota bacterium]
MVYLRRLLAARPQRSRVFRYTLTMRATVALLLWAVAGFGAPARLDVIENYGYGTFWLIAAGVTILALPFLVLAINDALWSARGRIVLGLEEIRYRGVRGETATIPYSEVLAATTDRVLEGLRPHWLRLDLTSGQSVRIRTLGLGRWGLFLRILCERAGLEDAYHTREDIGRTRDVPVTRYEWPGEDSEECSPTEE